MALSGVAQLVAHVETDCDCVLALAKWRHYVLDFVEQPHVLDRDRRMVRKVVTSSICLSVNGTSRAARQDQHAGRSASRKIGTPRTVRTSGETRTNS